MFVDYVTIAIRKQGLLTGTPPSISNKEQFIHLKAKKIKQYYKLIVIIEAAYLNPADADAALKQLLDGTREEERDGESHSCVQGHRHKDTAG